MKELEKIESLSISLWSKGEEIMKREIFTSSKFTGQTFMPLWWRQMRMKTQDSTCHGMSLHQMKIGRNKLRPTFYNLLQELDLSCTCDFRIDPHAAQQHQMRMKITHSEMNFPLQKRGLGGFEFLETNRIPLNLLLAKGRGQYNRVFV